MSDVVPRLEVTGLGKTYGAVRVLDDVSLSVAPGEVHALLGQNGSGKSTLIKLLSGIERPDTGAVVRIDGDEVVQPIRPDRINAAGMTFIHQSLGLVPGHSVTENVRLAVLSRRRLGRFIDWSYERARTVETLERLHSDIDPDGGVDRLHTGQRAVVAIARALQFIVPGRGCVVLDESTQSLAREVLPEVYATIRSLAREGTSVLLVSHRLDEVLALADRVTILRDGRLIGAGIRTDGLSEQDLGRRILGRRLTSFDADDGPRPDHRPPSKVRRGARIEGLRGAALRGVDLEIRPGEIVGVTGATDSGHEEVPYLITGAVRATGAGGSLQVGGRRHAVAGLTVAAARRSGVALVPADRANRGLAVGETAMANLTLPRVRGRSPRGLLRRRWQRLEFESAAASLRISPPDPHLVIASFSGGNQQKILVAKWLLDAPELLVLHEPTQAVDVGARADILHAIRAAAALGTAVLITSIEAQDLALVCDRVVVLDQGLVRRQLARPFTADDILAAA